MAIKLISPDRLRESPYQTRSDVSVVGIGDLVKSIRRNGQDEPCAIYRDDDGGWTIFSGHRRVLACASLGRKVLCRIIKKPDPVELMQRIYRQNSVLRKHTISAIVMSYLFERAQGKAGGKLRAVTRELGHELNIRPTKVTQCLFWWRKLVEKCPATAARAVKEKWSEHEVRVGLGLPTQRQHKAKADSWGAMRPEHVVIRRDQAGGLWMSCRMRADADAELLQKYYRSRRWPEPVIVAVGDKVPA